MQTPKPSEEEMILYFYGESNDSPAFERALAADPDLAARYERLRSELAALPELEDPEPSGDLAARVWRDIRPALAPHRSLSGALDRLRAAFTLRPGFALAAVAALALAGGVVIGRVAFERSRVDAIPHTAASEGEGLSSSARERLLLASVGDHLSGSERLFANIANGTPGDEQALAEQSRWAASLAASNRLYRSAAERSGQRRIVALLDELEPLLLELANAPSDSPQENAAARRRIDENDLLFKLRVAGERIEQSVHTGRSERLGRDTRNPTGSTRSTTTI